MKDPDLVARAQEWMRGDPSEHDRSEIQGLIDRDDEVELASRFVSALEFGTAGIRGPLRAGPNGMNLAVVRRLTAAVGVWVKELGGNRVVIGYDARHRSYEFAHDAAEVLAGLEIEVLLADQAWPTPVTAFAVRCENAAAGIQITASHNPAADNGYKVYDSTGAQILPHDGERIAAAVVRQPPAIEVVTARVAANIGDDLIDRYCNVALLVRPNSVPSDLKIVYTPLHGVGGETMLRLFEDAGFRDVHQVETEFVPNPDFPNMAFPNPEEAGVLDAAVRLATDIAADIVIANDPDADRLAVCVDSPIGGWRMLTGDELGLLLGEHLMGKAKGIVARSSVSSHALDACTTRLGSELVVTPTGFKWLSRAADSTDKPLLFAYEEALGYAVTNAVRDKDGLTAALVIAEIANEGSLLDKLQEIAKLDGIYVTTQWAPRFDGPSAKSAVQSAMAMLGRGDPVELVYPDGRVLIRGSGTEAKLKCYFETRRDLNMNVEFPYELARREGIEVCDAMKDDLATKLGLG